jgi:hypothetical protein
MAVMQFKNKVLILGLIAGGLAAAYALGLVFSPTNVQKRRSAQALLPGFKTEAVARIEVSSQQGGTIQVTKEGEDWKALIAGSPFPASAERVGWFLDSMAAWPAPAWSAPIRRAGRACAEQASSRIRLTDAGQDLVSLIVATASRASAAASPA